MTYEELLPLLQDLHSEFLLQSPDVSTVIMVADHVTGEARYYSSGFAEVQATMIKMLLDKDKLIASILYLNAVQPTVGS